MRRANVSPPADEPARVRSRCALQCPIDLGATPVNEASARLQVSKRRTSRLVWARVPEVTGQEQRDEGQRILAPCDRRRHNPADPGERPAAVRGCGRPFGAEVRPRIRPIAPVLVSVPPLVSNNGRPPRSTRCWLMHELAERSSLLPQQPRYPLPFASRRRAELAPPGNGCGTAGIKPTAGRVPRTGHVIGFDVGHGEPLTQPGPIARFVEDLFPLPRTIAGLDQYDPAVLGMPLVDPQTVDIARLHIAFRRACRRS